MNKLQNTNVSSDVIVGSVIDSFEFTLRNPVSYAFDGQRVPSQSVQIHAPGVDLIFESYALTQMVTKAAFSSVEFLQTLSVTIGDQEKFVDVEDNEKMQKQKSFHQSPIEASEQVDLYLKFSDIKIKDAISEFRNLALEGCVRVNNKKLTQYQWKELRNDDVLDMFMQFLGVFILPSIFSESPENQEKMIEGQ